MPLRLSSSPPLLFSQSDCPFVFTPLFTIYAETCFLPYHVRELLSKSTSMALTARSHRFFQGLSDERVELSAKFHACFMFSCSAPSHFLTWPPLPPPPALLEAFPEPSGTSVCPSSGTHPHLHIYHVKSISWWAGTRSHSPTWVWHKVGQLFAGLS